MDAEIVRRDARAVSAGLEAAGFDLDALAAHAGYPERLDRLDDAALAGFFLRIWRSAIALSGDPTLPLAVGDAVPFGAYEVVDYLASSCSTVGSGLTELARYFALVTPSLRWTIDDTHDPPRVFLDSCYPGDEAAAVGHQYAIGVTFGRFRRLAEGELAFASVELAMPPPPDVRRHQAFFAAPVRYGAPRTIIRLPRRSWSLPMRRGEPGLRRVLESHARDLLERQARMGDPLAEIRAAVRARLKDGDLKVEAVARDVATSSRTLQRRLAELGTTFQAIVDDERRAAAETYLREERLAVGDVAYMLGYSEPSAFVRAFKRWTGTTPHTFRKRALG